jgi:hypothetical protein
MEIERRAAIVRHRRNGLALLMFFVTACGGSVAPASDAQRPSDSAAAVSASAGSAIPASEGPSASVATPSLAMASAEPQPEDTFMSTVYPYRVTFPPGVVIVRWHAAERAWNGSEEIDSVSPFVDRNGLIDGAIFIVGTPWTGTVDALVDAFQANVQSHHGCAPPIETQRVVVDRAPAIAWRQRCSGNPAIRVAAVHGGWGLVASQQVMPEFETMWLDRFVAWIRDGLTWRKA